jgi:hypothetical protein
MMHALCVWIGSQIEQPFNNLIVTRLDSELEGRQVIKTFYIDAGSTFKQELTNMKIARSARVMEWIRVVTVG